MANSKPNEGAVSRRSFLAQAGLTASGGWRRGGGCRGRAETGKRRQPQGSSFGRISRDRARSPRLRAVPLLIRTGEDLIQC